MKIRTNAKAGRTIQFPGGRSLAVTFEGVEVPANLEKQVRQAVQYVGDFEITEAKAAPAPARSAAPRHADTVFVLDSATKDKE